MVSSVSRTFRSRKNDAQRAKIAVHQRLAAEKGRPTRLQVDAATRDGASRSAAVISAASSRFQMSHITQRQLQRLCAFRTRIGIVASRSPVLVQQRGCLKATLSKHAAPAFRRF